MFNALVLNQEEQRTLATIEQIDESQLPSGDVLIAVDYSSLNYKDGLAITGKGKIIRNFPMVPESIWQALSSNHNTSVTKRVITLS